MATKTQVDTRPAVTGDWLRVTVTGLQDGPPALLGFYSELLLGNGSRKRCGQVARVTDEELLRRLRTQVHAGHEIYVCTSVDNEAPDCPLVLTDFRPA